MERHSRNTLIIITFPGDGVIGSVLALVDLVSVCCDWMR